MSDNDTTGTVIKMALAVLIVIAALVSAFKYPGRQPVAPPKLNAAAAPRPTNVAPASSVVVPNPEAPPASDEPAAPVSSADVPDPSAAPLEDLIERAMPAIVLIETQTHRGSGFFVAPDLVVTNHHVVAGELAVTVTIHGGQKLSGRVAQSSADYDLALVQVVGTGPPGATLTLGDSAKVRLGQGIVALGWAQTLTQSPVTRGVVTGLRHDGVRDLVQTDAAPNPGDSGGPLLDKSGQIVGITTLRDSNGASGFALAINDAKPFVDRFTSAATASSRDAQRGPSTEKYTATLTAIANKAAELDITWSRYKTTCGITAVPAGQSREWFALYEAGSPLHHAPGGCATALNDIDRQTTAVRIAMIAAEEAARQGDVYPGTRRDLRRRYRLDYPGWER